MRKIDQWYNNTNTTLQALSKEWLQLLKCLQIVSCIMTFCSYRTSKIAMTILKIKIEYHSLAWNGTT